MGYLNFAKLQAKQIRANFAKFLKSVHKIAKFQYFAKIITFSKNFQITRPGGEGGNGPPEGKFIKLGGKVNFGVLSSKIDVIRAKKGAISLVLTNKASFSC